MDELHPQSFTGLLIPEVPIGPQDLILGAENNRLGDLGLRVIIADGNWLPYIPFGQVQNKPGVYDTSDCTGFGYCRDVAAQLNGMRAMGWLSNRFIDWAKSKGYIQVQNGRESFMFDPRVLGILAGTTSAGNWLQVVAQTAKVNGLVPAGTLPGAESANSVSEYYNKALITAEIAALGKEFLQYIDLPYNWITDGEFAQTITACPLYVALCTCGGWNNPPVPWCHAGNATNHCVAQTAKQRILDSYAPFDKPLSADYTIPYKMQVLAVERQGTKEMTIGYLKEGTGTIHVQVGNKLVPVADWPAFLSLGGSSNSVVVIAPDQFAKFEIAGHTLFKSEK